MTKKSLIIGINYKGTPYQLNGCINDVWLVKQLLEEKNFDNILMLNDDTQIKPTKSNILKQMEILFLNSKEGDELFLSFSGHGSQVYDTDGDEKDGRDEVFISMDLQPIYDDEVRRLYQKIPKGVKVFVLMDCCNSGTNLDLPISLSHSYNSSERNNYFHFDATIFQISGCKDPQYSYETRINGKIQGLLTYSFYQIMSPRKWISGRFFLRKIEELVNKHYYSQNPQLSSSKKLNWSRTKFSI